MPGLMDDLYGYSGLTPDQSAVVRNQGWFYNPDAQNTGLQQPYGYSGLTPDQIQAVNTQGYYTPSAAREKTLMEKLAAGLGADNKPFDLNKTLSEIGQPPQAQPAGPRPLDRGGLMNPYLNIYRRGSIDPRAALKALLGGGY
jgi:hypothetical protein